MLKTAIVSVTFRKKSVDEVIEVSKKAGLDAIEWGSDVHVPQGDIAVAKSTYEKTVAAGLEVASYGSYYYIGEDMDFKPFLESAIALHAPNIRVWAGKKRFTEASGEYIEKVVADARRISAAASEHSITISTEYHDNTLTNTLDGALALIKAVPEDNFFTYWQPPIEKGMEFQIAELKKLLKTGRVSNFHVFYRHLETPYVTSLLSEGEEEWCNYISLIANDDRLRYMALEFVSEDSDESLYADAGALRRILARM